MTNEELGKLDFQVATMKMLQSNTALLWTVLDNQVEIMKALNMGNHETISAGIRRALDENLAKVNSDLKSKVPVGDYIKYKKN